MPIAVCSIFASHISSPFLCSKCRFSNLIGKKLLFSAIDLNSSRAFSLVGHSFLL